MKLNGQNYVRILVHAGPAVRKDTLGYFERCKHVELIRNGAPSYMIMCRAVDSGASPRTVASVNKDDIFIGRKVALFDDDEWLQIVRREKVAHLERH